MKRRISRNEKKRFRKTSFLDYKFRSSKGDPSWKKGMLKNVSSQASWTIKESKMSSCEEVKKKKGREATQTASGSTLNTKKGYGIEG